MRKNKIKLSASSVISSAVLRLFLIIWTAVVVFPLFWMIYTSVKSKTEFIADRFALPKEIWIVNYFSAWNNSTAESSLLQYFLNTLLIVIVSTLLFILMVSATSYALAKYRFRLRKTMENFYFIAMMIPSALVLIPLWFQLRTIGNNLLGSNRAFTDNIFMVALIYAVQALPASIFLLVSFIRSIHNGFIEAAVMDGAREWTIFSRIILPFVRPILTFVSLGHIMNVWNEYTLARTFLESEKNYTISLGIQSIQNAFTYSFEYGALFACLVLSVLPIMILYIVFQKQIQNGTDASEGIKG